MKIGYLLHLIIYFLVSIKAYRDDNNLSASMNRASFPPSFIFGTASAAYQYEGAAAEDGRNQSMQDAFIQKHPDVTADHSNASIADDQYHRYKEDVALMKDLGFDVYRFSISWPRVLPHGSLSGGVNHKGIHYYNNLINELLSNGIKPVVTIFHWDIPQTLEDKYLGFLSHKIIDDFRDFADLCFKSFGDRVKLWITFNEPLTYATAYSSGFFVPNRCSNRTKCPVGNSSTEPYIVGHNQLLAHAVAVKLYKEKYKMSQKGKIGIALSSSWVVPYSDSVADKLAANRSLAFQLGWFMDPIHTGPYPPEMIANVGERLPKFSKQEFDMVKGSYDFVGLNYYTASYAANTSCEAIYINYNSDRCTNQTSKRDGVPIGPSPKVSSWIRVYPEGLRQILLYIKNKYNDPIIYITENGIIDPDVPANSIYLDDQMRIEYFQSHISNVHDAIMSGVKVNGYMAWSLLDNFEWSDGYTSRFGIVHVDFENGTLKRTPKQSAWWFKQFLSSKK